MAKKIRKVKALIFLFVLCAVFASAKTTPWFYDEAQIKTAMENGELIVYIQPIFNLNDASVASGETLSRWVKDGNTIMPGDYIPQIENSPFIKEFDVFMVEKTASFIKEHLLAGVKLPVISVNVSRATVSMPGAANDLITAAMSTGIDLSLMGIEITETFEANPMNIAVNNIEQLRAAGFKIYLDDYGAGFYKKTDIEAFDPDVIKLDKSFVPKKAESKETACWAIQSVVKKAAMLNKGVIAEGLEDGDHVDWARNCGISVGQGFFLGKPMGTQEFVRLVNTTR